MLYTFRVKTKEIAEVTYEVSVESEGEMGARTLLYQHFNKSDEAEKDEVLFDRLKVLNREPSSAYVVDIKKVTE